MKNIRIFFSLLLLVLGNVEQSYAMQDDFVAAAYKGRVSKIQELLAQGVDVNGWDSLGSTALHEVAFGLGAFGFKKKLKVAQVLLEVKEVEVDKHDRRGLTPLMIASLWNNEELIRLFVAAGANVNAQSERTGNTALHWVVEHLASTSDFIYEEAIKALLQLGANPYIKNKDDKSVFDLVPECFKADFEALVDAHARVRKIYCSMCPRTIDPLMDSVMQCSHESPHIFHRACVEKSSLSNGGRFCPFFVYSELFDGQATALLRGGYCHE